MTARGKSSKGCAGGAHPGRRCPSRGIAPGGSLVKESRLRKGGTEPCAESESSAGGSSRPGRPTSRRSRGTSRRRRAGWRRSTASGRTTSWSAGPSSRSTTTTPGSTRASRPAASGSSRRRWTCRRCTRSARSSRRWARTPGLEQELTAARHRRPTSTSAPARQRRARSPSRRRSPSTAPSARWDRFWAERNPGSPRTWRDAAAGGARRGRPDAAAPPRRPAARGARRRRGAPGGTTGPAARPTSHAYLASSPRSRRSTVEGDVETGKMSLIKEKQRRQRQLQKRWGAPQPPWLAVSANLVWNIHNTPAAQISMLGKITGLAFAPVAACSTFGVTLKLAMDAIERGEAKAVVIGATDPPPHPLSVGAFYCGARDLRRRRRLQAADRHARHPRRRRLGDLDRRRPRAHARRSGFQPLGMEPVAVGVSSDADHIITPSIEGPTAAIAPGLRGRGRPARTRSAPGTSTPPPRRATTRRSTTCAAVLPDSVLVTARKGTFGHGMSAGGRLGADRAVPRLRARRALPDAAPPRRAQPADRRASTTRFVFDQALRRSRRARPASCRWASAGSTPA